MHIDAAGSSTTLILLLQFEMYRLANLGLVGRELVNVALLRRQLSQLLAALVKVRREVSKMKVVEVRAHLLSVLDRVLKILQLLAHLRHGRRELDTRLGAERLGYSHLMHVAIGNLRSTSQV